MDSLDIERAMVLMGIYGSTSSLTGWGKFAYAETSWAPDCSDLDGSDESDCVTVLVNGFSGAPEIPCYKVVQQWASGEQECPWCGCGTGNESERESCTLCEGDGYIYWGEEWQVVTYAPHVPSESEVAQALDFIVRESGMFQDDPELELDIRLQVYPDGQWAIRTGDSSFDLDHHGYWGASSLNADDCTTSLARDLISEVTSSIYENSPDVEGEV